MRTVATVKSDSRKTVVLTMLTFLAFICIPELRRLSDWVGAPSKLSLVLPLLPLILAMCSVGTLYKKSVDRSLYTMLYLFIGSLTLALCTGLAAGLSLSAIYNYLDLLMPALAGLSFACTASSRDNTYERVGLAFLICGAIAAVYAIFQWLVLPPWDSEWLRSGTVDSAGYTRPMAFRAFGLLNGPGVYASFCAILITTSLSLVQKTRPYVMISLLLCVVALMLTSGRAAWIATVVGFIIYAVLSTNPVRWIATVVLSAALLCGIFVSVDEVATNGAITATMSDRIFSLDNLSNDASANDRTQQIRDGLTAVAQHPLGEGLGEFGTASKLNSDTNQVTFLDSGLLVRLVEMGVLGGSAYFAAYALLGYVLIGAYRRARSAKDVHAQKQLAAAIAALAVIVILLLSGDDSRGVIALMLFAKCFSALRLTPLQPIQVVAHA